MSDNNSGQTNLQQLLLNMKPVLQVGEYVFLSFADASYADHANLTPIASFSESEGLTLVVPKQRAEDMQHNYDCVFRCITLQVHSSLEAVGLTAAFAKKLTAVDISANVIAGFYHDHIFVPQDDADNAMSALLELTQSGS